MTNDETTSDDAAAAGSDSTAGRRRFVQLSGSAIAVGLAGCSSFDLGAGDDENDGTTDGDTPPGSTPANRETETEGSTATATDEDDSEEATPAGTEEDVHEHGSLYLEVDGERHPFTDPKYYQPGEHPDAEATDRFHFHDDGNDYLWHMHGERLALAAALGELPDLDYESNDGAHVVRLEGDSYEDGREGTSVVIRRGDGEIDPAAYELQDGDEIWIEITTADGN